MRSFHVLAAVCILLLADRIGAQPAGVPSSHSLHGEAFDDGPRQQAKLLEGMGDIRFPVTAKRPEAQAFIEQGLAQVHTFYYFEAERSFRQAAFLDPTCAMAYWGMALANQNNPRRGAGFIRKAEAAATGVTDRERRYIEAVAASVADGKGDKERRQGYVKGLETVVLAYPDDIEAKALLAWGIISLSWSGERITSRVAVNQLIEDVLRTSPLHPGAHHYRIHLWDGTDPVQALASAEAYARAASRIAHAWHMPGHIYNGLCRWKEAAYQQEGSARIDHAHLLSEAILPFHVHNYVHNQHYLIAHLNHLGRAWDAIEFARNLVECPRDPEKNQKGDRGSAERVGRFCLLKTYVRFELWDDLLADSHLDWSDVPEETAWRAYSRGLAHRGRGDRESARKEAEELDRIAAEAAKKPGWDADLIETARLELRGRLLADEGKLLDALVLLDRGAKMQVEKFDGDLGPYPRPFHEALGFIHIQARNWGLAEACFRRVLEGRKDTVVSSAGLVEALYRGGRLDEAAGAHERLLAIASDADPLLPFGKRVQEIAGALPRRPSPLLAAAPSEEPAGGPGPAGGETSARPPPVDLETLGPKLWTPSPAPDFTLEDSAGARVSLSGHRGRNVVLIFHLGLDCPHCMGQLEAFAKEKAAFDAAGAMVLALSEDPPASVREFLATSRGASLPFAFLHDPGRRVAKLYRAHDTFEDLPLHSVVLIDREGKIRWSRASAAPFTGAAFVAAEAARVEGMLARSRRVRI